MGASGGEWCWVQSQPLAQYTSGEEGLWEWKAGVLYIQPQLCDLLSGYLLNYWSLKSQACCLTSDADQLVRNMEGESLVAW